MNYDNFTALAQKALKAGSGYAKELNNSHIENGHLLKGILEVDKSVTPYLLRKLQINQDELAQELNQLIATYPSINSDKKLEVSKSVEISLNKALTISKHLKDTYISVEHIFAGILVSSDLTSQMLKNKGITDEKIEIIIQELRSKKETIQSKHDNLQWLNSFATNLTQLALQGKMDSVIGRNDEIRKILQIISRRSKNNPIVIGEPGVGKTAVIEGLAQRIVKGDVPENLKGCQIFSLDMGSLIAGASKQGEFENRIKSVIKEVEDSAGDIILFIDEIHLMVEAGKGGGGIDAANILKPALARGTIKVIGATTINEYKKYIEKDKALVRRFQKVMVNEPTIEETISILRGTKEKFERFHKVPIKDDAIIAAVELSHRYVTERFLPDKAIDLIDEAAAKLRLELNTIPEEIDNLERLIIQLQTEKQTINTSENSEAIKILDGKIAEFSDERSKYRALWESQKQILSDIELTKAEIEHFEKLAIKAENESNFEKVAELRYGKIKENTDKLSKLFIDLEKNNEHTILLKESVDKDLISEIVSEQTGIPVNKMMQSELDKLNNLEELLAKRIIGQKEAISAIANAIRRNRAGLGDEKRPIGSFIFLGTTGVGKTELAKALAEFLFDDEKAMVRVDMSEYQEQHAVSKLIGSPPGYVGFDDGGQLTEAVRLRPYSVVLFDEMEKAHKDIFNTFLQVLDDGHLTDSKGITVNFKNTIIVMTSNAGSDKIMANFEQLTNENRVQILEKTKQDVTKVLKESFRPEFLNRIDEIIMFTPLTFSEIKKIAQLQLNGLSKKLAKNGIQIELSQMALNWLSRLSYNPQFGARPVKRSIQRHLLDELSKTVLSGKLDKSKIIYIDLEDSKFVFKNIEKTEIELLRTAEEEKLKAIKESDMNKVLPEIKTETETPNQEPGFWKRIGNWFKNIFGDTDKEA